MTSAARSILEAFAARFPGSAQARGGRAMRIAGERLLPSEGSASPDEKEAFLAAIDDLVHRGIVKATWKRHRRGEELASLTLVDAGAVFQLLDRDSPAEVATHAREKAALEARGLGGQAGAFLNWVAGALDAEDGELGMDTAFIADLSRLARVAEARAANLPLRALSIDLYHDSKRLEALLPLIRRLAQKAEHAGIAPPDISAFERSWPESALAGDVTIRFEDGRRWELGGAIVGLPLSTLSRVSSIEGPSTRGRALSVENKESFHVLSRGYPHFDCVVYAGGHLNEAARRLITILARSGFEIAHAGDLDPDGLLILEEVGMAAGRFVEPWRMDLSVFERYLPWGRRLEPSIVARLGRLSSDSVTSPLLGPLVQAIRDTSMGIEQEIIDYGS